MRRGFRTPWKNFRPCKNVLDIDYLKIIGHSLKNFGLPQKTLRPLGFPS